MTDLADNQISDNNLNETFLKQPFLQFVKQELASTLTNKDILIYELIKQFENNNIRDFEIFKELEMDDVAEILDSLVSLNQDAKAKRIILIQLKLLINRVQEEMKSNGEKINNEDIGAALTADFYLQLDSKVDYVVTQFNDFKQRLFKELPTNTEQEYANESGNAPSPPALTPAASMTTLTPFHNTKRPSLQSLSTSTSPQIQTPTSEEPFKQLKASKQDSSQKILMNAMIKHNIPLSKLNEYILIISYQDKEIIMTKDDKPVEIFKSLKKNGFQPAIMLREVDKVNMGLEEEGQETPGGRL